MTTRFYCQKHGNNTDHGEVIRVGSKVKPAAAKGNWTVRQIDRASDSALCTAATFGYWFPLSSLEIVQAQNVVHGTCPKG